MRKNNNKDGRHSPREKTTPTAAEQNEANFDDKGGILVVVKKQNKTLNEKKIEMIT